MIQQSSPLLSTSSVASYKESANAGIQKLQPKVETTADSVHFGQNANRKKTGAVAAMLASLSLLGVTVPAQNANAQTIRPAIATEQDMNADNITPVHHDRYYYGHGPRFHHGYPHHDSPGRAIREFLYLLDALQNAGRYDYPRDYCRGPRWNRSCEYIPDPGYHHNHFTLGVAQTRRGPVTLYRNGEVISARDGYVGHITGNGNAYNNRTFMGYAQREVITVDGRPYVVSAIYNPYDRPVGFVAETGEVFRLSRRDDGFFRVGYLDLPRAIDYPLAGAYALLAYPELLD